MEEKKLLKKKQKSRGSTTFVSACTDLAEYYVSEAKFSKAITEYEIISDIYKKGSEMILYAQANRGIGEAYMALQEFEKALKYLKIYLDVAEKENNVLEQQRALAQLGHLYLTWYLGMYEKNNEYLNKAYGYFIKSIKKCESLPDNLEKQDMLSRLFSNLGLVKESLKEYDTALTLYESSKKICFKYDLYEQLYRVYVSMASLLEKQEKYQETIHQYNLAIEVAKKLSSKKVELVCAALLAKSETLIQLGDFNGAKQVLRKAYKFHTPNNLDKKTIEQNLRVVAALCKLEDDIIITSDDKHLKQLYEKMGDAACALKNFSKAIEYYKKMLESAEKLGVSDKALGVCYYSLGETYKDNAQYKEAEMYFEKEYQLCKNDLKDSLNTLCKIADLKEQANNTVEEIKKIYERALDHCRTKTNIKEEKRIVLRFRHFLRRSHCDSDALKMEQYLNKLERIPDNDENSSSSDCESEDSQTKLAIGYDIILSDITDLSEESDQEVQESTTVQQSKRRKPNAVKFKKNMNGEWPLHVACIKGDLKMAQYWLDVNHPVNVRDNAGWLPIHEAAIHGHLDIVKLLLDYRASINDRGGSECKGVTPLHDAASNGHLEIVKLLLERGASVLVKTDEGHTPLFVLTQWYNRSGGNLSQEQINLYNELIKKLSEALKRAGQSDPSMGGCSLIELPSPEKESMQDRSPCVGHLRRNAFHYDNDEEETPESPENLPGTSYKSDNRISSEYQLVMQTLRHKNFPSPTKILSEAQKSAYVAAEGYIEDKDWLEEDIRPTKSKRRKTDDGRGMTSRSRSFGDESSSSKSPRTSESTVRMDAISPKTENMFANNFNDDEERYFIYNSPDQRRVSNESNTSNSSSKSRKKTQATLLDAGFSKRRNNNSSRFKTSLRRHGSFETPRASQSSITSFAQNVFAPVEADSTTILQPQTDLTQNLSDPTLFVDVEIEGRLFRVPVLVSQIKNKTIKWLANEAAQRYASKEYMKPTLELESSTGAILADDDLLSLLFPMGNTQAEKIVGKVIEWSLPPLIDRYKETCKHMNLDVDIELCQLIQTLSVNLDVMNHGILSNNLVPLLKAINHQKALTEINLSGNFLNMNCMNMLCNSLITLPNLQYLNLSCTGLQTAHLSLLASTFLNHSNVFLNVAWFDISDNIGLTKTCLKDLGSITKVLNLRTLNLSNISLSEVTVFQDELCLKTLKHLDVSNNDLDFRDIKRLVSWTDGSVLRELNVSNNKAFGALELIVEALEHVNTVALERIGLSRCGVSDRDLFELLRLAPNVTSLDLAYNPDITSISLRRLLEHKLAYLNLLCCNNVWKYFDTSESGWSIDLNTTANEVVFKISGGNDIYYDCISQMFTNKYPKCKTTRSYDFLCITLYN